MHAHALSLSALLFATLFAASRAHADDAPQTRLQCRLQQWRYMAYSTDAESIVVAFTVRNLGASAHVDTLRTNPSFDATLLDSTGRELARFTDGRRVTPLEEPLTIAPRKSAYTRGVWFLRDMRCGVPKPGRYRLTGTAFNVQSDTATFLIEAPTR